MGVAGPLLAVGSPSLCPLADLVPAYSKHASKWAVLPVLCVTKFLVLMLFFAKIDTGFCLSSDELPPQQLISLTSPVPTPSPARCTPTDVSTILSLLKCHSMQRSCCCSVLSPALTCSLHADVCSQRRLIAKADPHGVCLG